MEFRNLQTFLCVADLLSFSKAALRLGYSQSNVSFQIRQLEDELGVRLFERTGKTIQLTDPGREFLFYANEIRKLSSQALDAVKLPQNPDPAAIRGLLRVGSIESIATAVLPDLLTGFHRRYPHIQLTVCTESRDSLADQVRNNQIDLFFDLNDRTPIPHLTQEFLRKEEIVFLTGRNPGYPKAIPLGEIAQKPFVLTERGEGYRKELERLLAERDLTITPIIEFGNPETILHLVARDLGLSFLPLFCAEEYLRDGRLFVLETDTPRIFMYSQIFYHKNKWITPQIQALLTHIREYFSQPAVPPLSLRSSSSSHNP